MHVFTIPSTLKTSYMLIDVKKKLWTHHIQYLIWCAVVIFNHMILLRTLNRPHIQRTTTTSCCCSESRKKIHENFRFYWYGSAQYLYCVTDFVGERVYIFACASFHRDAARMGSMEKGQWRKVVVIILYECHWIYHFGIKYWNVRCTALTEFHQFSLSKCMQNGIMDGNEVKLIISIQ